MTDNTTPRCEPPEHLRGQDGWHWVRCGDEGWPFIARWSSAPHYGREPLWARYGGSATPVGAAAHWDWRYLAPVATPEEVEALRAELAEWRELPIITGINPDHGPMTVAHNIRGLRAERTTLRARVTELETALRGALGHIDANTCRHETTHRGGINWEICSDCGEKWAADHGGKSEYVDPPVVAIARAALKDET